MEILRKEEGKIIFGAILENLRELNEKVNMLNIRLWAIEKLIEEKIPEKALSENFFKSQIEDGNEIVKRIIKEIKRVIRPIVVSKEFGIVESKKVQEIIEIMRENKRISSYELGKILNLSRTRCNEYLKKMEKTGIVRGIRIGKRKYYQLMI